MVKTHRDLEVSQLAFETSMEVFRLSKQFPQQETYSLTAQIRRSSRSVSSNISEGWRKRRYEAAFVSKLNDAEAEAAETQTWLEYAEACQYAAPDEVKPLYEKYDHVIGMLVNMQNNPNPWLLPSRR